MIFNPSVMGGGKKSITPVHINNSGSFDLYYVDENNAPVHLYSHPVSNPVQDISAISGTVLNFFGAYDGSKPTITNCSQELLERMNDRYVGVFFVN